MKDYTKGGLIKGSQDLQYYRDLSEQIILKPSPVKAFLNAVKAGEKLRKILETLKHKDMKKECRIKEINEQIKRLKKEKKEMKEDKSVDLDDLDYKEYYNLLWVNTGAGSFWLSGKYNWNLSTERRSQILVPTKK